MKLTPHDFKLYVKQQARKIVAESIKETEKFPHLNGIIARMMAERATSVSDAEIERTLEGTVAAKGLIRLAKKYREEGVLNNAAIYIPHVKDIDQKETLHQKYGLTNGELYDLNETSYGSPEDKEFDKQLAEKMFRLMSTSAYSPKSNNPADIEHTVINRLLEDGLLEQDDDVEGDSYDDDDGHFIKGGQTNYYWFNENGREEIKSATDLFDQYFYQDGPDASEKAERMHFGNGGFVEESKNNSFVSEMFGFSKSNTNKKPMRFSTQDFRNYILSEARKIVNEGNKPMSFSAEEQKDWSDLKSRWYDSYVNSWNKIADLKHELKFDKARGDKYAIAETEKRIKISALHMKMAEEKFHEQDNVNEEVAVPVSNKQYTKNDFIKLKDEKFTYVGKSYTQNRFISKDYKFYITFDQDRYALIYVGKSDGKATILYDAYPKGDYNGHPIYAVDAAIKKINELGLNPEYKINVNNTHFKKPPISEVNTQVANLSPEQSAEKHVRSFLGSYDEYLVPGSSNVGEDEDGHYSMECKLKIPKTENGTAPSYYTADDMEKQLKESLGDYDYNGPGAQYTKVYYGVEDAGTHFDVEISYETGYDV